MQTRKLISTAAGIVSLGLAALVAYAMFGTYDWRIELIGFVLLAAAVGWDFRLRERAGQIPR